MIAIGKISQALALTGYLAMMAVATIPLLVPVLPVLYPLSALPEIVTQALIAALALPLLGASLIDLGILWLISGSDPSDRVNWRVEHAEGFSLIWKADYVILSVAQLWPMVVLGIRPWHSLSGRLRLTILGYAGIVIVITGTVFYYVRLEWATLFD